jgi:hypothetical protein
LEASRLGKPVQLLIGLNAATLPDAVVKVVGAPGVAVRYLTRRFHAKIYVFDTAAALLGSANLTDAGLKANREAVICLDQDEDRASVEEIRALFAELWEAAAVVTPDKAREFADAWRKARSPSDTDAQIEQAFGKSEPPTSMSTAPRSAASASSSKAFVGRSMKSTGRPFSKSAASSPARTSAGPILPISACRTKPTAFSTGSVLSMHRARQPGVTLPYETPLSAVGKSCGWPGNGRPPTGRACPPTISIGSPH